MAVSQKTIRKAGRIKKIKNAFGLVLASRVATLGMCMVLFWVLIAFTSLFLTPYNPNATDFQQNLGPTAEHWLGTDHLGRDLLSRLMHGTQVVLLKNPECPAADFPLPGGGGHLGGDGISLAGHLFGGLTPDTGGAGQIKSLCRCWTRSSLFPVLFYTWW